MMGGAVVAALLVTLLFIPHLLRVGGELGEVGRQGAANQRAMADMQQAAAEYEQTQWQAVFSDVPPDAANADFDQYLSRLERNAARLSGIEGKFARAGISVMRAIQPDVVAYHQAISRLDDSVGLDVAKINSTTDIDQSRRDLRAFRTAAERLNATMQTLPDRFTRELVAQQVPPERIPDAQREFENAAGLALQQHEHAAEMAACDVTLKLYDLLRREWGRWEYYEAEGAFAFESVIAERTFEKLMQEMQAAMTTAFDPDTGGTGAPPPAGRGSSHRP